VASIEAHDIIVLDRCWGEQALLLSQEAGWNQIAADWGVFLTHGTVFGIIVDERLVATAAALPYGPELGWISMVLVTRAWRGQGLATRLVAAATSLLREAGRAAFLDATPAGTAVYRKLGFSPLCTMQRWHGQGSEGGLRPAPIDVTLDHSAFGADRGAILAEFASRPASTCVGNPRGFAMLRQGANAMQLGPIVAEPSLGAALLTDAIGSATGPVIVDVLEAGFALLPTLAAIGFQQQRNFTRMALGRTTLPGRPQRLLAAAGPEFG
jgi:GNAT superfamily N-acetyltransferase